MVKIKSDDEKNSQKNKRDLDFQFMEIINDSIERKERERWDDLVKKDELRTHRRNEVIFIIVNVVLVLLAFYLETPH